MSASESSVQNDSLTIASTLRFLGLLLPVQSPDRSRLQHVFLGNSEVNLEKWLQSSRTVHWSCQRIQDWLGLSVDTVKEKDDLMAAIFADT